MHGAVLVWHSCSHRQDETGVDRFEKAVDCFEKADAIDPDVRTGHFHWARALWKLGRQREARQKYVEGAVWVAAVAEGDERQLHFRDTAEELLGIDERQRIALIAEYYSGPPPADADIRYWMDRASWHRIRRDYDQAIASYDKAIRISPNDAILYKRRGEESFAQGKYKKAIVDFDTAIQFGPSHARHILPARGKAYACLRQWDQAADDLRQGLKLGAEQKWIFRHPPTSNSRVVPRRKPS